MLPVSDEFTLTYSGVQYIAQIAQSQRNTSKQVFFVVADQWQQVDKIEFTDSD